MELSCPAVAVGGVVERGGDGRHDEMNAAGRGDDGGDGHHHIDDQPFRRREGKRAQEAVQEEIDDGEQEEDIERAYGDAGVGERGVSAPAEDQFRPVNPEIGQAGKKKAEQQRAQGQP